MQIRHDSLRLERQRKNLHVAARAHMHRPLLRQLACRKRYADCTWDQSLLRAIGPSALGRDCLPRPGRQLITHTVASYDDLEFTARITFRLVEVVVARIWVALDRGCRVKRDELIAIRSAGTASPRVHQSVGQAR